MPYLTVEEAVALLGNRAARPDLPKLCLRCRSRLRTPDGYPTENLLMLVYPEGGAIEIKGCRICKRNNERALRKRLREEAQAQARGEYWDALDKVCRPIERAH